MFRQVLCALDLNAGVEEVIQAARGLVESHAASVTLLYVVDTPLLTLTAGKGPLRLPEDEAEAVGRAAARLRAQAEVLLRELAERISPETQCLVLEGHPVATRILECLNRLQPDLLVVGSRPRRTFKRLLTGSVSDRLVHASPVPVLVARMPPPGWRGSQG